MGLKQLPSNHHLCKNNDGEVGGVKPALWAESKMPNVSKSQTPVRGRRQRHQSPFGKTPPWLFAHLCKLVELLPANSAMAEALRYTL